MVKSWTYSDGNPVRMMDFFLLWIQSLSASSFNEAPHKKNILLQPSHVPYSQLVSPRYALLNFSDKKTVGLVGNEPQPETACPDARLLFLLIDLDVFAAARRCDVEFFHLPIDHFHLDGGFFRGVEAELDVPVFRPGG